MYRIQEAMLQDTDMCSPRHGINNGLRVYRYQAYVGPSLGAYELR